MAAESDVTGMTASREELENGLAEILESPRDIGVIALNLGCRLSLRGINAKVVRGGEIKVDDLVTVERRGAA